MSVACDRCEAVRPGFCPRCRYLMDNMARVARNVERIRRMEEGEL